MKDNENNKLAINVYDEAKAVFWDKIKERYLNGHKVLGRLSIHDTQTLFNECVIPAIKKARELDREHEIES